MPKKLSKSLNRNKFVHGHGHVSILDKNWQFNLQNVTKKNNIFFSSGVLFTHKLMWKCAIWTIK